MNIAVSKDLILNLISDDLVSVLSRLGGISHIDMLDDGKTIADATTKVLISNKSYEKAAFLLWWIFYIWI